MNFRLLAAAFAVILCAGISPARAATISLLPDATDILQGDILTLNIAVSGLGDGSPPSVGVFDLDLTYDAAILGFEGVTYGGYLDVLGLGSFQETDASAAGTVNLFELSFDFAEDLDSFQPGAFTLAELSFRALAPGVSDLALLVNAFGDGYGDPLSVEATNNTAVNVSPVPLPTSFSFFISALALLGIRRAFNRIQA